MIHTETPVLAYGSTAISGYNSFGTEIIGFTKIFRICKGTGNFLADLVKSQDLDYCTNYDIRSTLLFYYTEISKM